MLLLILHIILISKIKLFLLVVADIVSQAVLGKEDDFRDLCLI